MKDFIKEYLRCALIIGVTLLATVVALGILAVPTYIALTTDKPAWLLLYVSFLPFAIMDGI